MTPEDFAMQTRTTVEVIGQTLKGLEEHVPYTSCFHVVAIRNNIPMLFYFLKSAHNIQRYHITAATMKLCAMSFNCRDAYGNTVMHYLALRNAFEDECASMLEHMRLIVQLGANLDVLNNANESVHHVLNTCRVICTTNPTLGGICFDSKRQNVSHIAPFDRDTETSSCSVQ